MKFLLALAVFAMSAVSQAASTRDLYDIMYLPNAGTIYGTTDAYVVHGKYEANKVKTDIDGTGFKQTLGYAIADSFLLSATMDSASIDTSPSAPLLTRKGISDPTISGRYRFMDDEYRLDFLADALLPTGDKEVNSNNDMNNKVGGGVARVGAEFGKKSKDFQWSLSAFYTRNFQATFGGLDLDAHNAYMIRGDVLANVTDTSFIRSFLSAQVTDGYKDNTGSSYGSANKISAGAEYQHMCSKNFMAKIGVTLSEIYTENADQFDLWAANIGANYQF
jgi:hypothetical protein